MSDDLTYNIKNIFNADSGDGVLRQKNAKKYYIAPYQRGYKWASSSSNDAVCVLISDLIDAANKPNIEYYLQFITTKVSKINNEPVLEVIDGQQRLTTLTILLSVLEYIIGDGKKAVSNDLLSYEVRPNVTVFFQKHIYQNIGTLISDTWEDFKDKYPENDEQDIFYLFNAARKIHDMLFEKFKKDNDAYKKFKEYLLEKVIIILNHVEKTINCEEIFSNLNDNRVELTSSELIKGLILTNRTRETPNNEAEIIYEEKMEIRAIMGRQWDEISHWANRDDINEFYFSGSGNVLDKLLLLLALDNVSNKIENKLSKNAVFNYFQSEIKKNNITARELFVKLKELKSILNEWYNDNEIYNSLGYLFFRKNLNKKTITDYLPFIRNSKPEIKKELKNTVFNILDKIDIDKLDYNMDSEDIHNLLLAINVFGYEGRFEFSAFNNKFWSLEHIFPQNPEELGDNLKQKDISSLKSLCDNKLGDFEKVKDILRKFEEMIKNVEDVYNSLSDKMNKETCTLSLEEKKVLYSLIKSKELHSIGNMALLTGSDNSSNGRGMFDDKRYNIVERISKGSFVPKHTYDVFSKLFSKETIPDLTVWTPTDIEAHFEWIKEKIKNIKSGLV